MSKMVDTTTVTIFTSDLYKLFCKVFAEVLGKRGYNVSFPSTLDENVEGKVLLRRDTHVFSVKFADHTNHICVKIVDECNKIFDFPDLEAENMAENLNSYLDIAVKI